ncbi:hypothetical protein PBRA_001981 [Plasmodiophora brassicae]|uniref:Regulator of telomere elongation helicase 1 homolog n=1 Tax=Plasmodiophora brassicae TaxID=37360 RepID=A0A0G4J1C0_PLABS|nr:hypothetical protein PBRA_001981 [Plasmodiophora brassicae]
MSSCARKVNGIEVCFPFETPYPAQMMVASKVLSALQKGQNALVESPTGTGKSLALLCSVLAYQKALEDRAALETDPQSVKIPTVYYMSRTHSQLTQVVKELNRTVYRPKPMTILGSREQLCINKTSGVSADENCTNLLNNKQCDAFNNQYRLRAAIERGNGVYDIEDLCKAGEKINACPYFTARSMLRTPNSAKLVLCPYNYVIDPPIRRSLGLSLKGSVLIFDEAHNIENVAREASSCTVSRNQVQVILDGLSCVEDGDPLTSAIDGLNRLIEHASGQMKADAFQQDSFYRDKADMLSLLQTHALGPDVVPAMRKAINQIGERYRDVGEEAGNLEGERQSHQVYSQSGDERGRVLLALRLCDGVCSCLELMYAEDDNARHFRLVVTRQSATGDAWEYEFSIWCLSPALAMQQLSSAASTIIVASGTLFPLGTFAAELGTSFEQRVEAPHVISPDQILVGVVPLANNQHTEATFQNVHSLDFQDNLAETLLCLACIIPSGVLVFFPSYTLMETLVRRWKNTRVFSKINKRKKIFLEDRRSGAGFDSSIKEYRKKCTKDAGAMFFAVYRGKLSEGIDFADNDARAVVCIGIPFPNATSLQVKLKKEHNTDEAKRNPNGAQETVPSGREWYCQQAYRALNQSIGRVIRHRLDYGAVILVDARYQRPDVKRSLSKWVRQHVVTFKQLAQAESGIRDFFTIMKDRFPPTSTASSAKGTKSKRPPGSLPGVGVPDIVHTLAEPNSMARLLSGRWIACLLQQAAT